MIDEGTDWKTTGRICLLKDKRKTILHLNILSVYQSLFSCFFMNLIFNYYFQANWIKLWCAMLIVTLYFECVEENWTVDISLAMHTLLSEDPLLDEMSSLLFLSSLLINKTNKLWWMKNFSNKDITRWYNKQDFPLKTTYLNLKNNFSKHFQVITWKLFGIQPPGCLAAHCTSTNYCYYLLEIWLKIDHFWHRFIVERYIFWGMINVVVSK